MKAAIAGKDDEAFPAANAPKKVLALPVTRTGEETEKTPAKSEDTPETDDPGAADGGVKNPAAPASPQPVVPSIPPAPAEGTAAPITRQAPPRSMPEDASRPPGNG